MNPLVTVRPLDPIVTLPLFKKVAGAPLTVVTVPPPLKAML